MRTSSTCIGGSYRDRPPTPTPVLVGTSVPACVPVGASVLVRAADSRPNSFIDSSNLRTSQVNCANPISGKRTDIDITSFCPPVLLGSLPLLLLPGDLGPPECLPGLLGSLMEPFLPGLFGSFFDSIDFLPGLLDLRPEIPDPNFGPLIPDLGSSTKFETDLGPDSGLSCTSPQGMFFALSVTSIISRRRFISFSVSDLYFSLNSN